LADEPPVPITAAVPRKIVCLETYWGDHNVRLFQNRSVRLFLEALSSLFDPPIRIAHRFVDTAAHLAHYTARPDGLLWRDPESFDVPVFYLSFHGAPGTLRSSIEHIGPDVLLKAFESWGGHYANLVHFGACSVFAGREGRMFAQQFLHASKCRAVLGYTTDIDWMDSMVTDLLFFQRLFRDADPWTNLRAIHDSVLVDFPRAKALGFELHLQEG
jgi:hypothetical protein